MGLDYLTALWTRVRDSLWFLPALLTLAAAGLAALSIHLDSRDVVPADPDVFWLFTGTASGARGVLSAIASSIITVTGVIFSVTIVALQLASSQFTPRILRNFTADRANQLVLGIFIGTFTYALLVLRVVRDEGGGSTGSGASAGSVEGGVTDPAAFDAFVPNLSVTMAVLLALVSIAFLIFFIDHTARAIQASVIIDRVTGETLQTIERLLPRTVGVLVEDEPRRVIPQAQGTLVPSHRSGYVQGVDEDALIGLLGKGGVTIRMDREVGAFVLEGEALATVWPGGLAEDDALMDGIRHAFVLGHQRTPHLDPELGVIELVDIAVKALSPSINDPTTAVLCVDRIAEVLLAFSRHQPRGRVLRHEEGGGILVVPGRQFDRMVRVAFDQIRHYGAGDPRFTITLLERMGRLGSLVPDHNRTAIAREVAATLRSAGDRVHEASDLRRIREAADEALAILDVGARARQGRGGFATR